MKEGICSKCGAASVYRRVNGITWEVAGGVVIHGVRGILPGSRVESYVCTRCGYFESYVLNAKQLAQIEKEWAKVG